MNIGVIGAGFVGLTTSVVLCETGNNVFVVEVDQERLKKLKLNQVPFYEPGLKDAFKTVTENQSLQIGGWKNLVDFNPDAIVICGGTPSNEDGSIDLRQIDQIISTCIELPIACNNLIIKSTVLPGTTRLLHNKYKIVKPNLKLAMVPEFLREGSALDDARNPDRTVIGSSDTEQIELIKEIFGKKSNKLVITSAFSAESIKYASNTFLATCISFANDFFGTINNDPDFEIEGILEGWHSDKRFINGINRAGITSYLKPGFGFGGSCFPKDVKAFRQLQIEKVGKAEILDAVLKVNTETTEITAGWIEEICKNQKEVVVFGVAFKENSDDLRESPSLKLMQLLAAKGFKVFWFDPYVESVPELSAYECINESQMNKIENFILTNNDVKLREYIEKFANKGKTLFLPRYQKHIEGFKNIYPKEQG